MASACFILCTSVQICNTDMHIQNTYMYSILYPRCFWEMFTISFKHSFNHVWEGVDGEIKEKSDLSGQQRKAEAQSS